MTTDIEGPLWCAPGLVERAGRYPLAVEAPVMAGVEVLAPGVSTLTAYARYYSLYWALAAHAAAHGVDREACRRLVRRAEVGLAMISHAHDAPDDRRRQAHGVSRIARILDEGAVWSAAEDGAGSYSPRAWGFWSQYGGSCVTLGLVTVDGGALRPGRHLCPAPVRALFAPLIDVAEQDDPAPEQVTGLTQLALQAEPAGPDMAPLAVLFAADGGDDTVEWVGDDRTRRSTLRLLARAWQLHPVDQPWENVFAAAVAYGAQSRTDPLIQAEEERAAAWRGVLLRRHSVGAWRRLWAELVSQVRNGTLVSRTDLHDWISAHLPDQLVAAFTAALPPVTDRHGDPTRAEEQVSEERPSVAAEVAVLLLGANRLPTVQGTTRKFFVGRRPTYLDPSWVVQLYEEYQSRSVRELGRRLVDDMLAQSRRVAMRKLQLRPDGTMAVFSRLHERDGWYTATSEEGNGNVGLRLHQLGELGTQLGLMTADVSMPLTPTGRRLLGVPA